jgi:hypothetical protein
MYLLAELHPAAPAQPPSASIAGWVVLAVVLAVIVASGVILTSRR